MFPLDVFNSTAEIFSSANWFLIFLAIVWMISAVIQDFRKREVANWWNFSFIVFVLAYRFFLSVEAWNYAYLLWGLVGLLVGFILSNAFYYARMFAGGDAKLLMAIGTILPLSLSWKINLEILFWFVALFLVGGAIYGLIYSIIISFINFRKFKKRFVVYLKRYNLVNLFAFSVSMLLILISIFLKNFYNFPPFLIISFALLIFISPLLFFYAKSIEDTCMNRLVSVNFLTIGDWLVKPVKAGRIKIRPDWEGLSEEDLKKIQKNVRGKILVKYGIPFTPSFLIGFIGMLALFLFKIDFFSI